MPATIEGDERAGPEPAHDGDLLFNALATVAEAGAERAELDGVSADADP